MTPFIIVDIDGTISKVGPRLKYLQQDPPDWDSFYNDCFEDEPVGTIIDLVYHLFTSGYKIVFCTGRRSSCREKTVKWIRDNFPSGFYYTNLLMRLNGDHRHDTEIKPGLLESAGYNPDNVAFILEDRNSMVQKWRELGYTCLQVADGDF